MRGNPGIDVLWEYLCMIPVDFPISWHETTGRQKPSFKNSVISPPWTCFYGDVFFFLLTDCAMVNHHLSASCRKMFFLPPKKIKRNQPNPSPGFPEFGWMISGDVIHQDTNTSFPNTTCAVDRYVEVCVSSCQAFGDWYRLVTSLLPDM